MPEATPGRVCREVRSHLPAYVDGTLRPWRRRLVALHLKGCSACGRALAEQQAVAEGLQALAVDGGAVPPVDPPEGLLDALLADAQRPGVRGRVAVPARGAVSGARPALSLVLLVAGAAAGYAGWRATQGVRGVARGGR